MSRPTEFTVIEPGKGWAPLKFRELWSYRELLYFLAWRDIKIKYKQTFLGIVWVVLQPLLATIVFSVLFGRFARIPSEGAPYPVFVYMGLLLWNYFASVLGMSTGSLVTGANLISKIYFPRLIIPVSPAITAFIDLLIGSAALAAMLFYYGVSISPLAVLAPPLILITMVNALGFGIWAAALNVRYRDVQYMVPFLLQIWMFMTPVIYPSSMLDEGWRWLMFLNPMTGAIEALRAAILGATPLPWAGLALSASIGAVIFISGVFYFRRVERYFADVI